MPVYEYECENGHTFETHQSIKDEPLTSCTTLIPVSNQELAMGDPPHRECGASVHRLISKSSFILKGGGWTGKG